MHVVAVVYTIQWLFLLATFLHQFMQLCIVLLNPVPVFLTSHWTNLHDIHGYLADEHTHEYSRNTIAIGYNGIPIDCIAKYCNLRLANTGPSTG